MTNPKVGWDEGVVRFEDSETARVRDKTAPPIPNKAARSDQERIQGRWQAVDDNWNVSAKGSAGIKQKSPQ